MGSKDNTVGELAGNRLVDGEDHHCLHAGASATFIDEDVDVATAKQSSNSTDEPG